jgi:photosystem II stability/assembly factor-like uncharacterized protein
MKPLHRITTIACVCVLTLASIFPTDTVVTRCFAQSSSASDAAVSDNIFSEMKWRSIGPYRGGRSLSAVGIASDPLTYYFGATGGGVWKTTDGGANWSCVSDNGGVFKTSSVGALAVAPSDPNVLYAGMGETDIRGNIAMGDGVYRSTDAGATWKHVGLRETEAIGKIVVHPQNPDVVYVAAMGHIFGSNKERGVYRTTDGGTTWKQVLFKNDKTGAVSIALDPANPRILYAAMWQAYRAPHEMSSGGDGSGLWKSTDGGDTWTDITRNPGLPKGVLGKIGVAVSPVNSNLIWAIIENENGGVFRSNDAGKTWTRTSDDRNLRQRAWYYSRLFPDPKNPETVYATNVQFWKSVDGGKTFKSISTMHGDHHDLWIDPNNAERMIVADDGGAAVSSNGGKTWTPLDIPTAQFYHCAVDNEIPYRVFGAQQDNSSVVIKSRSDGGAVDFRDWFGTAGGESGYITPHPAKPHIVFGGSYGGFMTKHDMRSNQQQNVSPFPEEVIGEPSANRKYRFQWTYPIVFSPHDANTLYATAQVVFRSRDEGMSWDIISPDLTRNDKSKQAASGGPITKDNTGVETYNTIFTFAESPVEQGVLWSGSDCGLVHVSRDNGTTWQNVTPSAKDLPELALISMIECSPHDKGTAYVAANRYKLDDKRPYIFKTTDYGKTWTKAVSGIPEGAFVRVVREDPNKRGLLYTGTETGVFVAFAGTASNIVWQPLQQNLPVTPVHDLAIQKREGDLVAATHGRSLWILDDLSPLYYLADKATPQSSKPNDKLAGMNRMGKISENALIAPRRTYRWARPDGDSDFGLQTAPNSASGVVVHYTFAAKRADSVALDFLDAAGNVLISYSNKRDKKGKSVKESSEFYPNPETKRTDVVTTNEGLNRFVWDMRLPDATEVPLAVNWGGSVAGPRVMPGKYQVRLTSTGPSGKTVIGVQPFEILKDPRTEATDADFAAQFALAQQIHAKVHELHKAINQIRDVKKQVNAAIERAMPDAEKPTARGLALKDAAKPLLDSLNAVENELIQSKAKSSQDVLNFPVKLNNKLMSLASMVASSDNRPTKPMQDMFTDLVGRTEIQLTRLKPLLSDGVAKFNKLAQEQTAPVQIEEGTR